jgi:hypothetical protein
VRAVPLIRSFAYERLVVNKNESPESEQERRQTHKNLNDTTFWPAVARLVIFRHAPEHEEKNARDKQSDKPPPVVC